MLNIGVAADGFGGRLATWEGPATIPGWHHAKETAMDWSFIGMGLVVVGLAAVVGLWPARRDS